MKTAKDLLDELDGGGSRDDRDDWLAQRMRTAHQRVWDTQLPMIDTRGVPPDEGPWEDSWEKRIQRAFTGLEDIVGLGLKSTGQLAKGRAAQSDEMFNNFVRDIYEKSGREDTPPTVNTGQPGELIGALGDYFYNAGHTPEREKAFNPNNKWEGADLRDVIRQGKFGEYLTDTDAGFLYDLPYNLGNIAGFLLPTRAGSATRATRFAGEMLNPLSGLLGKAGATRAADFIGSKAAREALGSGVHFGTTMGPYGAMVNAGTIIDELKKQGKSDTEIADAMGNLVREELPADIAFAALTGNVVKGKLGNMIAPRGSSLGRKIAANAAGIPLEMAGGNLSNVNQMILSEKYSGQPYGELFGEHTPAENKAGFMGAMAGVPFALYGGGRGVVDARAADKAYERFQKYIAEGKDLREAALRDMPQMARDAYRDAQSEYESAKGINAFMRAISGQESDGNYDLTNTDSGAAGAFQIMPDNWATWAQDAGLSPDAPMTPENQDRVARNKMLEYYNKFGNWRDVAIAWYAGEGAVGYSEEAKNRPQYSNGNEYPSINAYADSVMSRFQNAGGGESGGRRGGYVGEGGKGEGTYWVRNDGVSFDGAQPQLLDAMDMLGKKVYDDTGVKLVASAGTNGSHPSNGTPHGHDAGYKVDIVDAGANGVPLDADGVLFTKDFQPTEYCHKLIEYGRQLGLGMNLEGVGTQNVHLDVALDGTQWDGNGDHAGGFNPKNGDMRSDVQRRADELFDQRFRERVTPQRQEEPMKARQVDLNDSGLHDAFARDRMTAAIDNNDADAAGFWKEMFSGDTFNNTEENRAAVRQRYGTELEQFAQTYEPATVQAEQPQTVQNPTPRAQGQGQTQQQQAQPQQQKPTAKNTSNKYIRGDNNVIQAGNNFLEELRAKGTQADAETVVRLLTALQNNDTDTVRNILEANNRPIVAEQQTTQAQPQQQTQTQTEPVKQNQPPENVIQQETPQQESTQQQQPTKPKKQPKTGEEKAQAVLNKPLQGKKSGEARRKAGRAVIFLADKNGIEISDADRKSLGNGKTAVVNQWRDILIGKGILSPQITQSSPKQSSPAQPQPQQQTQPQETAQPVEKPLTLQERAQQIVNKATEAAGQNWEGIKRGYQERGRVAKSDQSIIAQQEDDALEDSLYRDDAEEERQAKAEQRQIRDDKQNDDNFEAELPTLRQAQYWLYDNGNEQSAREMEDAIRERSLYKAHLIADRTNVPQEILPRVPQQSDTGRRATPVQNPGTGFDALVTKARQYQNILLEDGDTQGAQAIEDAIQNRDEAALRDLPTTREEISAREEQTRRKKQDREVEAKRQRQEDDAVNAALATPSADEFSRKKQGARILGLINAKSFKDAYGTIELPPGLEQELQNGRRKGIETAQDLLRERGVTERTENPEATKERGQQQRDAYYDDELDAALEEPSKDKAERQERQLSGQKESADVPLKETKPTEAKTEEAKAKPETKLQSKKTGEKVSSEGKPKRTQKSTSEKIQEIAQNTKEKLSTILKLDKYTLLAKEVFEKIDSSVFEFDNGTTKGVKAFRERCEDFVRQATSIENIDEFAQKRELERFNSELNWMGPDSALVGRGGLLRERASDGAYLIKLSPQEQKAAVKKLSEQREEAKRKVNSGEATPAQALEELREARQKVFADIKKTLTDRAGGPDAITRWSMEGEADTRITNVIEDESTLTPPQKLLKSFSEKLGVPLKFFRNPDGKFHGSFSNGVLFLNVNSKKGLGGVFWHEAFHWLKANNPKLYAKLVDAAGITDKDRQAFLDRTGRKDLKTNEEIDEEILADQMDDVAKRTGLLQSIAGKNRGVVERVVQWLKDTMNKFIETFRNPTGRFTTKQAQALAKEFGQIARQLKDENGEQIFRVNNRTGDIEVVGGRKARELSNEEIETAAKSLDRKLSFAGINALTADLDAFDKAEEMASKGASREEIFRETKLVRGKDGLYRFEIPDNLDKIDFAPLVKNGRATLGEIYKNSKLYAAYPKLRDIEVVATSERLGGNGAYWLGFEYDPVKGHTFTERISINLSPKGLPVAARKAWAKQQRGSLIHEIQHAIQAREQFATGGDAQNVRAKLADARGDVTIAEGESDHDLYWRLGGEQEAREAQDRAELKARKKEEKRLRSELTDIIPTLPPDTQKKFKDFIAAVKAKSNDMFNIADSLPDDANKDILTDWADAVDGIEELSKNNGRIPQIHGDNAIIIRGEYGADAYSAQSVSNPDDNSSESLGQKIKNFASTVFNGKPQSKNHKQFIVDKLEELTRYKTYFNTNAKNEADVIVDSFQKIIRARHAYDFEKLLPATGEPIAKVLGLNPSEAMSNYIADWMMTGAINNTSKEATAFQKAMRAHPAEAELLQSIRDTFQTMANMSAEEAVESNIVRGKKSKTFREWLGEKFSKEEWVDDLHPIKRAYDQMLAKAPPAVADIIKKNFDPYMSASLFRGKGAIADMMIGESKEVTDKDIETIRTVLQREFPNVNFSDFKPLAAIAKMVDYDVEGLERYALAKLDKEMHEKKNSGDAKYADLTPSYTEAQCDEIIKAGKAKYDAAQRELVNYANTLAAIQYSTGVISVNQFYQRVNGWKNYVPTARVFEEYEDISVDKSDSSKHKTGSKRRVYAPLGKLEDNTNLFIRQALQNRARLEIVTMARLGNFGDIFAETPKGYPQGHTIHFKENGKMKYLVTPDESLKRAVEAIQTPADANIVVQAFKTAGMIMRGLYTMFNAEFMVGNPFRDLADAFIHNKYGSRNPFVAIPAMVSAAVSGLAQSVGAKIKTEEFRTFLAEGGAQSGFSYEVTEGASRRVNSFGKKSLAKSTWDKFLMIAEASENMTRFSTFKTAKDNLAKQHGGVPTPHDLKLAAMQARRATVDFARAGHTMRGVNKVALFSNAAMQSLALWGETINAARKGEEGALGELFTKIFKTVMGGVMPALAFAALNFSDDDRRKSFEQRHTWEKDTYWIFGDGLRVPKGMDLGIKLTSALTEEFAMWLASNKPVEWKRIVNNIGRGLPSITTTVFTPAVESWFNYSIFKDAPIVPYGQKDDPKYKQYGKNTSWVAKQLGKMFNQSPRQIDHLIAGYGGSMATALTGGSDGIPVVRRFMFDPDKNPRIVQDYYKALEEQEEMLAEYKARRADGEKVELPEDYDRGLHARLKKSREAMTKISKAEMRIMDDPKLDADTRKEKLRELEKRRVALCERVFGKAR